MPRSRDILQRFRPAGTPGAASNVGVPADRVAEIGAELAPVFSALAEAQEQAAAIRAEASSEAEHRRQQTLERAASVVAAARRDEAAERSAAALRTSTKVTEESAALRAGAERDVEELRRRAAERMPALVDRVVSRTRAALDTANGPGP
ncbi:MAG: hypothetical protein ACTHKG_19660 [Nocardioides sp.]